ncbi:hypothetical protein [Kibdelosporangium philippinense]
MRSRSSAPRLPTAPRNSSQHGLWRVARGERTTRLSVGVVM